MFEYYLIPLFWVLLIDWAAFSIGYPVYRRLAREGETLLPEVLAYSMLLGFIGMGVVLFALGVLKLLYVSLLAGLVFAAGLWGAWQRFRGRRNPPYPAPPGDSLLLVAAVFLSLFFLRCFVPLFQHDEMVYHLTIPRIYLEKHGMEVMPYNLFFNMPHYIDLLFTLPMALGHSVGVLLFSYQFNWLILAGFWAFAAKHGMPWAAGPMAILYVSSPEVQWHFPSSHVEPALGCFLLYGCLLFLDWLRERRFALLVLCALFGSWCMGGKYTMWYFVFGLGLSTAAAALYHGTRRELSRGRALALLLAWTLPLSVWLIRNALVTGNPVYPVGYDWLGGRWWSELQNVQFYRIFANNRPRAIPPDWWWAPLFWVERTGSLLYENLIFSRPFSLTLVAGYAVALLTPATYRKPFVYLLGWSLLGLLGWRSSPSLQIRFLVAILPLLVLTVAGPLSVFHRKKILWAGVNGVLLFGLFAQAVVPELSWKLLSPREYERVRSTNFWFYMWNEMGNYLPPDAKLFGFFENRIFSSRWDCLVDSAYESPSSLELLRSAAGPEAAARTLADLGVTHVLVNWENMRIYYLERNITDPFYWTYPRVLKEKEMLETFLERECRKIFDMDKLHLFELHPRLQAAAEDVRPDRPVVFHGNGAEIRWPQPALPARIKVWLDWDDEYEMIFRRQETDIARRPIASRRTDTPGAVRCERQPVMRVVEVPAEARESGFDSVLLRPVAGDGHYLLSGIECE